MLFNSYVFVFIFLPVALAGFWLCCSRRMGEMAVVWLVMCSLFFYGWWYPPYLALLISSIVVNYLIGKALTAHNGSDEEQDRQHAKLLLAGGIAANLLAIGYFKYAGFIADSVASVAGTSFGALNIILPLAISFFTFQQIAYLIDCYRGKAEDSGFRRYFLFVSFFPQLIAGPIVLHRDVMPQFQALGSHLPKMKSVLPGVIFFSIGLFKKVVIADHLAIYADLAFTTANSANITISFFEAWSAALTYSLQLYFDFSGYSDMAVGLGLMFGIRLPLNFNSPYKASSIIDFWRRWHMTLSRFLRECLYFPLGGSHKGEMRRYVNLMIVMLLGGLWHGAGWTFVLWGGLHGIMLLINHLWRATMAPVREARRAVWHRHFWRIAGFLLTFLAVTAAWVVFRAESTDAALRLYAGLFGFNGIVLPPQMSGLVGGLDQIQWLTFVSLGPTPLLKWEAVLWIVLLLPLVWLMPNTQQLVTAQWTDHARQRFHNVATPAIAAISGVAFGLAAAGLGGSTQFLYFQF